MQKQKCCGKEGHKLEAIASIVAYKCTKCDYYIKIDNILRNSFGIRKCPKCEAEGKENIDCDFSGTCRLKYACHNCEYTWVELR